MTPAFERLQQQLKQLPGIGFRSAERIALHLLVERPARVGPLLEALAEAARSVRRCTRCGNLAEAELCAICGDERRDHGVLCVVELVPDLVSLERSGAFRGAYHVLHGKLSPIQGVGPAELNFASLFNRVAQGTVRELILALSNDVEGEATCHYLTQRLGEASAGGAGGVQGAGLKLTRIGFGLPSGGGVVYADAVTLKSALESRRHYQ